jgi:hypothetical protein
MRPRRTKNKGDLGVLHAQLDLAEKGFGVLAPLTEHEAFDLVAYRGNRFLRIQVKYRAAVRGCVELRFTSFWADRHGTHTAPIDKSVVDLICVFCPDTRRCYYVDPKQFRNNVSLRIAPTRNHQRRGVRDAEEFTEVPWPLSSAG